MADDNKETKSNDIHEDHPTKTQQESQEEIVCELCPFRCYSGSIEFSSNLFYMILAFILLFIVKILFNSLHHTITTLHYVRSSLNALHAKVDNLSMKLVDPKQKEERKEELNMKNISNIIENLESLFRN